MDPITALVTSTGGVALEPLIEHSVMQWIPASLNFTKPAIAWLIGAAYSTGSIYVTGGDWRQAVATTVGTAIFMELKHASPLASNADPAQPAPAPQKQ